MKKKIMKETESLKLARKYLGKEAKVVFDRPMGTKHHKFGFVYEVNYGYIPNTPAPDGEDLDAFYLGADEPLRKAKEMCIAVVHRNDDDDDKLVVVADGCSPSDEEIMKLVHFQERFFDSEIVR